MPNYIWTEHTPGHIAVPVMEKGKVKMIVPDDAEVKAASEANARHDAAMRRALKAEILASNKAKRLNVPAGIVDAQVAAAKIGQKVRVPVARPEVTDVVMSINGVYDLPADNEQVMNYVKLGYLKPVDTTEAVAATDVE